MLRITNFPAAAAEEVSSKEKPAPVFPTFPLRETGFAFGCLLFCILPICLSTSDRLSTPTSPNELFCLTVFPPPNSPYIFFPPLSVYWSQSQNVNKCSRGADFFWILSCVPFLQLPASSTHPQVRGRFLFLSAMVKFISAAADSNQV